VATYKLNIYYSLLKKGWTESFYKTFQTGPVIGSNPTAGFLRKMADIRGRAVDVDAYRWTNTENPRETIIRNLTIAGDQTTASNQELAESCVVFRLEGTNNSSRNWWVRGLRDNMLPLSFTGRFIPTAALNKWIVSMRRALTLNDYQIRRLTPTTTIPWMLVSSLSLEAFPTQFTVVNVIGVPPVSIGDVVYFSKIDPIKFPQMKGQHKVIATAQNSFTVAVPYPCPDEPSVATPKARTREVVYLYETITNMDFSFYRSRQTGRPFRVSAGRR